MFEHLNYRFICGSFFTLVLYLVFVVISCRYLVGEVIVFVHCALIMGRINNI